MDNRVIFALQQHFPGQRWQIERPATGWRKACYIASRADEKYFLKFDVPVGILKRLGEIRVAPRVLFAGEQDGLTYVIQEFVGGVHPESREWMRRHLDELVAIVKAYHEDGQLRAQLAESCPTAWKQHIRHDLEWLSRRLQSCPADYLRTAQAKRGFERLINASDKLRPEPLVPIHNDPSPTNILFGGGRFVFLDWDEITLSDPMRDIGMLLWWNFRPDEWPAFFGRYGSELTVARQDKIYWFAARASLDIALWHAEHSADGRGFTEDFLAAVDQQPNPKGY